MTLMESNTSGGNSKDDDLIKFHACWICGTAVQNNRNLKLRVTRLHELRSSGYSIFDHFTVSSRSIPVGRMEIVHKMKTTLKSSSNNHDDTDKASQDLIKSTRRRENVVKEVLKE
ncbi:hypothetical protein KEM48_005457 [Puccinia striiformis f. sp. tritici PST-130]|nr:hypothetical protein KEM48_005457 [Puccinia striiformis f. sp. tritici PST-130]